MWIEPFVVYTSFHTHGVSSLPFSRPLFEFVLVLSDFIPTETTEMNSLGLKRC